MATDTKQITATSLELQPYLFITGGKCEEALNFYKSIFGGEITGLMRWKEMPSSEDPPPDAAHGERIMNASFKSPAVRFMAADASPDKTYGEGAISLALGLRDTDLAQKIFEGLANGGKVEMPLQDMFWGAKFGMLTDRYGIDWMINCQLEQR